MTIEDQELGVIILKPNIRAKRVICRYKDGLFILTHPTHLSLKKIKDAIESMRPGLKKLKNSYVESNTLKNGSELNIYQSKIKISENELSNFYYGFKDNIHHIVCPKGTDYRSIEVKELLKNRINRILRKSAQDMLPQKVAYYASLHRFSYQQIRINSSRGRWGSCSSRKDINLSYFCMLLPEHLLDFVILHELCHTVEMNHGTRFWQLLDAVTQNRAKELTKELALQSKNVSLGKI